MQIVLRRGKFDKATDTIDLGLRNRSELFFTLIMFGCFLIIIKIDNHQAVVLKLYSVGIDWRTFMAFTLQIVPYKTAFMI